MGCGCKTSQQLSYLQKKYGYKLPESKKTNIKDMFLGGIKSVFFIIFMIPAVPIVVIYLVIRNLITKKPVDINKIFKIKK